MATYDSEILLDEDGHNITEVPAYSRILELVQGVRRGLINNPQLSQPYLEVLRSIYEGTEKDSMGMEDSIEMEEDNIETEEEDNALNNIVEVEDDELRNKMLKEWWPTRRNIIKFMSGEFPPIRFRTLDDDWGIDTDPKMTKVLSSITALSKTSSLFRREKIDIC